MKKTIITLVIILLLSALFLFAAINGLKIGSKTIPSVSEGITLDLDLIGGSEITYQAQIPDGTSAAKIKDGMEMLQTLLRQRLDNLGYKDAMLNPSDSNSFVVKIPQEDAPEELALELSKPAAIQFVDYEGTVFLDSNDISSATAEFGTVDDSDTLRHYITVILTSDGYEKFKAATKQIAAYPEGSNYLEVIMDDMIISKPLIDSKFADTGINTSTPNLVLDSSATDKFAEHIAKIISSGHLAFKIKETDRQVISSTLGGNSLKTIIYAGLIGLVLIMIYMLFVYRLPGIVADLVFFLYVAFFLLVMSFSNTSLSLPGIAGIMISISIYFVANIIIYHRLREELRSGTSLKNSVIETFKKADGIVVDIYAPLMIIAAIFMWQGADNIQCFSRTLLIGIVLSLLCIRFFTKAVLRSLSNMPNKNHKYFGV